MKACVIFLKLARVDVVGLSLTGVVELRAVLVTVAVTMLASQRILLSELLW